MLFKLSNLNSNLALTLGYLNPALNNSTLVNKNIERRKLNGFLTISLDQLCCDTGTFEIIDSAENDLRSFCYPINLSFSIASLYLFTLSKLP